MTVESSTMVEANSESVESWSLHDVAPVGAFHPRFNVRLWLTAPLAGDVSVGVDGIAMMVVKLQMAE